MSYTACVSNKWWGLWLVLVCCSVVAQDGLSFSFEGNTAYETKTLHQYIAAEYQRYEETGDISHIDDAAYKILRFYREAGYHFANVDYEIANGKVVFAITENSRIALAGVEIVHADGRALTYPQERLRKFLTPPPLFQSFHPFQKSQVVADANAIAKFYISEGYLQANCKVEYQFSPDPPNSTQVKAKILVDEGPLVYLTQIAFSGNDMYRSSYLRDVVLGFSSSVYRPGMQQALALVLREFYRREGYARATVVPVVRDLMTGTKYRRNRALLLEVSEQKKNYIRHISVSGNAATDQKVILRQLDIAEGDPYDLDKIRRSEENIQATGIFLWVEIREKLIAEDLLDLEIVVEEGEFQSISLSAGYGTLYGPLVGIGYEHINVFGTGRRAVFSISTSQLVNDPAKSEARLRFIQPHLFESRTWGGEFSFFGTYEKEDTFESLQRGVEALLRKKITPEITAELGYRLTYSDTEDDNVDDDIETLFSTLFQRIIFDYRDNAFYPTWGSIHSLELEESLEILGSDVDYCKFFIQTAWFAHILTLEYSEMVHKWVLAASVRGGVIFPFGDTEEIPIEKRYFGGGPASVRSFEERQMPPLNAADEPIGGEGIFLASLELRMPVYGNLGVSIFADTGQVIEQVRDFEDYSLDELEYALGFSIWYLTPVGPIRFDYAVNPDVDETPSGDKEDLYAWFISIGFSF